MKLLVEIEVTEEEARYIRECSVERVMNSARDVSEFVANARRVPPHIAEKAALFGDIEDAKPIATRLWNAAREAVFRAR